jgi:hypothetical protein
MLDIFPVNDLVVLLKLRSEARDLFLDERPSWDITERRQR